MSLARRILVVEDDPTLQEAMRRRLADRFEVATAPDLGAALRWLTSGVPDAVCIDLGLPYESGYELCEHIRRTPPLTRVPILVTSERSFPQDMAHAEDAGANVFLRKPFSMTLLAETIDELWAGPRSRRDVRRLRSW